jgi:hypothetical protein
MNNKPYYPIISENHTIVKDRTEHRVHIQLHTILTKLHSDGNTYEYDVVRRTSFKENSTIDTIHNTCSLYRAFIIDIHTAQNNIIVAPELLDITQNPIFRKVDPTTIPKPLLIL